jgi:hypothetical protein
MLKKIVISLSAVAFILGAGSSFAASLSSVGIINGETTKAEITSKFGEPMHIDKDTSNRDRYVYEKNQSRLQVSFENDVVWNSLSDSLN